MPASWPPPPPTPIPACTLTDNGMVFTTRLSGGKGGRNALQAELAHLGVTQKIARPNKPTTCGKVERFPANPQAVAPRPADQPATIDQLQHLLDRFVAIYNHQRPHRSLPGHTTPAAAYQARPKATPADHAPDHDTHDRVRSDRVDPSGTVTLRHHGRLHHIGIGRAHARTRVLLLIQDLHIRVVNATTGELLHKLILDPTRDYQPLSTRHHPQHNKPRTQ